MLSDGDLRGATLEHARGFNVSDGSGRTKRADTLELLSDGSVVIAVDRGDGFRSLEVFFDGPSTPFATATTQLDPQLVGTSVDAIEEYYMRSTDEHVILVHDSTVGAIWRVDGKLQGSFGANDRADGATPSNALLHQMCPANTRSVDDGSDCDWCPYGWHSLTGDHACDLPSLSKAFAPDGYPWVLGSISAALAIVFAVMAVLGRRLRRGIALNEEVLEDLPIRMSMLLDHGRRCRPMPAAASDRASGCKLQVLAMWLDSWAQWFLMSWKGMHVQSVVVKCFALLVLRLHEVFKDDHYAESAAAFVVLGLIFVYVFGIVGSLLSLLTMSVHDRHFRIRTLVTSLAVAFNLLLSTFPDSEQLEVNQGPDGQSQFWATWSCAASGGCPEWCTAKVGGTCLALQSAGLTSCACQFRGKLRLPDYVVLCIELAMIGFNSNIITMKDALDTKRLYGTQLLIWIAQSAAIVSVAWLVDHHPCFRQPSENSLLFMARLLFVLVPTSLWLNEARWVLSALRSKGTHYASSTSTVGMQATRACAVLCLIIGAFAFPQYGCEDITPKARWAFLAAAMVLVVVHPLRMSVTPPQVADDDSTGLQSAMGDPNEVLMTASHDNLLSAFDSETSAAR